MTEYQVEFPELHGKFAFVIHFTHSSVHLLTQSPNLSLPYLPPGNHSCVCFVSFSIAKVHPHFNLWKNFISH